jgi:hypothetical protein
MALGRSASRRRHPQSHRWLGMNTDAATTVHAGSGSCPVHATRLRCRTKDTIMTAGERLIQQGEESGIQKGIQQGKRALLLRQLRKRFGHQVDANAEQRLATASAEQIDLWAERVLSAATLAELLAD